jgi:glyoxylase-like metal-dependent hydrolase (beta-lactamase superfamily II)
MRPMSNAALPPCFTRLDEMDSAWAEPNPGHRLEAVRAAGDRLRHPIRAGGPAVAVHTFDLATLPYPSRYAFEGVALSPAPYIMMTNRMQLVQVAWQDRLINVLVNPTDPERSMRTPFFARQIERYGQLLSRRVLSRIHGSVAQALDQAGVAPEDIDYITFDHLHTQDVRGLLGTGEPEPGRDAPTPPLLPNARLLAQAAELRTLACLHPLQQSWYIADALRGVPGDRIVALEGDYLIGGGLALVRTPGHTEGNHSPVLVTDRGLWTISENGVAVECYAPAHSRIPGLRRYARDTGADVVLNGNTRENSLDQYTSMVLEKTIADPCPDRPELPQHFPSSELTRSALSPGLGPTYRHGAITHGQVRASGQGRAAPSGASAA